jgi:hypothetical protein
MAGVSITIVVGDEFTHPLTDFIADAPENGKPLLIASYSISTGGW